MLQVAPASERQERYALPTDRDRVDLYLRGFLARSRRRHAANPHVLPLFETTAGFVLKAGKRLRPRLALASYRIFQASEEAPPRPVWLAAASLELFHAFMLTHDDLIDGSLMRRGEPTLPESLRASGLSPNEASCKQANDLGMIAGDLLFALGMRMISRSGLESGLLVRVNRLMADMLLETGLGEALDVLYDRCPLDSLDEPQILDAYIRKTARYSVSGPMVLGSMLAGGSRAATRALSEFGDLLGVGFQIQNDLDCLEGDDCSDLDGGKRTWILWKTHQNLSHSGRESLHRALALPVGAHRRTTLLDLIETSGAVADCRSRLATLQAQAVGVLRDSPLDRTQRRAFLSLVDLFRAPCSQVMEAIDAV